MIIYFMIVSNMDIHFYYRELYGNAMYYFADETEAKVVRVLTGRKTMTQNDIVALRALGCNLIEVENPNKKQV